MFKILSLKRYIGFVAAIVLASMIGGWNAQAMEDEKWFTQESHTHGLTNRIAIEPQDEKEIVGIFQGKFSEEFQEIAENGTDRVKYLLGVMYFNGLNVPQDEVKALLWLNKSGTGAGAYIIGQIHEKNRDLTKAQEWYTWAAMKGHASSLVICGDQAYMKKDYLSALTYFEKAGEKGDLKSQFKAGLVYLKMGSYNEENINCIHKAYECFEKAFMNKSSVEEAEHEVLNSFISLSLGSSQRNLANLTCEYLKYWNNLLVIYQQRKNQSPTSSSSK